jgi:hypothetical protein
MFSSQIFVSRAVHRAPSYSRPFPVTIRAEISGRRFFAAKADEEDDGDDDTKVSMMSANL